MTMSFRRYVTLDVIGIATLNAIINASYTAWLWRSAAPLPLHGTGGIALDLAGTPVWIAMLATLLGTGSVQRKLWEGRFREPQLGIPPVFRRLPANIALRAAVTGMVAAIMLALPLWMALYGSPVQTLSFGYAVGLKVALTAMFSACIVPFVVLAAVADMRPQRSRKSEPSAAPRLRDGTARQLG